VRRPLVLSLLDHMLPLAGIFPASIGAQPELNSLPLTPAAVLNALRRTTR